jgi:dUTP diphosphatase
VNAPGYAQILKGIAKHRNLPIYQSPNLPICQCPGGESVRLLVKRLSESATLPAYAHPGDAGLDLFAAVALSIEPGESKLVGTGISIELPPQSEAQVRPRSGLALKHGVTVLNTPGTIDHGYRGEVGVILINHGRARFDVQPGMKIAQMVIAPCLTVSVEESGELSGSVRGQGGFGSTGV